MDNDKIKQELIDAYELMLKAFATLVNINNEKRSRELSITITELETAMMWLNKDRAVRGYITKSDTHVQES